MMPIFGMHLINQLLTFDIGWFINPKNLTFAKANVYQSSGLTKHDTIVKAEDVFSAPIKEKTQCNASLHLDFHKYLWSHAAGIACHREG